MSAVAKSGLPLPAEAAGAIEDDADATAVTGTASAAAGSDASATGLPRGRVLMLLDNAFDPDPRVAREARSLTRAGWQVRIVCWDREAELPEQETVDGVEVVRVRTPSGRQLGLKQLRTLSAFYREVWRRREALAEGVDVIHAHDLLMLPLGAGLKRTFGAKLVYDAHEIYVRMEAARYPAPLLSVVDRAETLLTNGAADAFVTVSDQRVDAWWERRIRRPPIRVCGNWYDPREVDPSARAALRAEHGIPEDAFVVGYAGGLNRNRRVDLLVAAARALPEVHALVAGRGVREPELVQAAGSADNVHFLGWVDDPWAVYQACDALFYAVDPSHPYASLSAPNNAYAALALGLPLIAGGGGEAEALVRETGHGQVLPAATVPAVVDAVGRLRAGAFAPDALDLEALRAARSWRAAERALLETYEELWP